MLTILRYQLLPILAALLVATVVRASEATQLEVATVPVLERVLSAPNHETVDLPTLASVIREAAQNRRTFVALIVQARLESHGSARVQKGQCESFECDPIGKGANLRHRARGLWQVHSSNSPEDQALWERSLGLTREAMLAGATLAAKRLRMCKTIVEMYSAQDGRGCRVTQRGERRAKLHAKIEQMIAVELGRLDREVAAL